MKLYTVEFRDVSNDTPRELICVIEHLFSITNALDNSDIVLEYKIGSAGVYFDKHPLGSQCDKLVTKWNW